MKHDPQVLLQQLNTLQAQISELAIASPLTPKPAIGEETPLKDLKAWLQQLASAGPAALRQKALETLDRFLSLTHQDQPNFAPLEEYQAQVRDFRDRVATLPESELPADVKSVADGQHPVSALLTLIEKGNELDDAEWGRLNETIAKSLGKPLSVAVSRGKLVFGGAVKTPPPSPVQPAASPVSSQTANSDVFIWGDDRPSSPPSPSKDKEKDKESDPLVVFGAKSLGLEEPAIAQETSSVPLKIGVHIQGLGDREFGAQEFAGTRGQGRGIEGFQINFVEAIPNLQIEYMAHLAGIGDTPWISGGQFAGTRGENRRLEGFAIRLTGSEAANYQLSYLAHIQNVGDSPILSDGKYCGTRGKALQIEAMKVWVQRKS